MRSFSLTVKPKRAVALSVCSLALLAAGQARGDVPQQSATSQTSPSSSQSSPGGVVQMQGVIATLEQCVTAVSQTERSATFAGEMASIVGATRMQMRINVEERLPEDTHFHTVSAPGLGVWRSSAPGVKSYKYIKQVTNLSAPAFYRAAVRFRWLNVEGHLIKAVERRTPACEQPAPPPPEPSSPADGGSAPAGVSSLSLTTG